MSQFLEPKYLWNDRISGPEFFVLLFVKGLALGNFGSHYFHESQIFDKQLDELPYLQSVGETFKNKQC
jgi:hypothetical protein